MQYHHQTTEIRHLNGQWAEVVPGKVWIGSGFVARSPEFFKQMGIQRVVNATRSIPNYFEQDGIKYTRVPVDDHPRVNLWPYFTAVADYINQSVLDGAPILVHCMAGQSRSVSLCIAYLIMYHGYTFEQARSSLARQKTLSINRGFELQLRELGSFYNQMSEWSSW